MKQLQRIAIAALTAFALAALAGASTASATTLETKGVAENAAVPLKTSVFATSMSWTDTFGVAANTCTASTVEGKTEGPFTGTTVGGPVSSLSWNNCTEGTPVVDAKGSFSITNIAGTTNGTLRWSGSKWTTPSFFGNITCTTDNTDIGTVNGAKEGTATVTINAVLSCTVVGTAKLTGTYTLTSPSNLGVGA